VATLYRNISKLPPAERPNREITFSGRFESENGQKGFPSITDESLDKILLMDFRSFGAKTNEG
jgi:hypothetical protein